MKFKIRSADEDVPEKEIDASDGERIPVAPGDVIEAIEEGPVMAVPQGSDLALFYEDGSSVILEGFFDYGPDEEPPQLVLPNGASFTAGYDLLPGDGSLAYFLSSNPAETSVGYEPFPLSQLGLLGLSDLVTEAISDFLSSTAGEITDVGRVDESLFLDSGGGCSDGGVFSGSGLVTGTDCNDTLIATSDSANTLAALDGDDVLILEGYGDVEDNVLIGGGGSDSLRVLTENAGADISQNSLAGDELLPTDDGVNGGQDTLLLRTFGRGADVFDNTLFGGAGDEIMVLDAYADVDGNEVFGGGGSDTLRGLAGADFNDNEFSGGAGADFLSGAAVFAGSDNLFAGDAGNDSLFLSSGNGLESAPAVGDGIQSTFNIGLRNNTVGGGDGSDTIEFSAGEQLVSTLLGGEDTVGFLAISGNSLSGGAGNDTLEAVSAGDFGETTLTLPVMGGDDSLVFFDGNTLDGGEGDDRLFAYSGRVVAGEGGDTMELFPEAEARGNLLLGGGGRDNVYLGAFEDVEESTLNGGDSSDDLLLSAGRYGDVNLLIGGADGSADTLGLFAGLDARINTLDAGGGSDSLVVDARGVATENSLSAGEGNDSLLVSARAGATGVTDLNLLDGAGGTDILRIQSAGDTLSADVGTVGMTGGPPVGNTLLGGDGADLLAIGAAGVGSDAFRNILLGDGTIDDMGTIDFGAGSTAPGNDILSVSATGIAQYNLLVGGLGADSLVLETRLDSAGGGGGVIARNTLAGDDLEGTAANGVSNDFLRLTSEGSGGFIYENLLRGGGDNDDLFVMSTGAGALHFSNSIEGGDGNDTLGFEASGAGSYGLSNRVDGGGGDDQILISPSGMNNLQAEINANMFIGGDGLDTVRVTAEGSITDVGGMSEVEAIDFTNSGVANELNFDTLEVSNILGTGNQLTVFGDGPVDTVFVDGAQWTEIMGEVGFRIFEDAGSTGLSLRLQDDLTIDVTAPPPVPFAENSLLGDEPVSLDFTTIAASERGETFEAAPGSLAGGDEDLHLVAEDLLDVGAPEYAAAFAAIDNGGGHEVEGRSALPAPVGTLSLVEPAEFQDFAGVAFAGGDGAAPGSAETDPPLDEGLGLV